MELNEATLVTPIFTGSDEENTASLSIWQGFLYTAQGLVNMTNTDNSKALASAMIARLDTIINPPSTLPAVQPSSMALSPAPVAPVSPEPSVVDLSFESAPVVVKKKVAFDHKRALELAGLIARI